MPTTPVLDSCPFCGSSEIARFIPDEPYPKGYAFCRVCRAYGPEVDRVPGEDVQSFLARIAAAWNDRREGWSPSPDLPQFRAGEEIDLTGGVPSEEFVRRQRDEW